jgi:hypothetical protein
MTKSQFITLTFPIEFVQSLVIRRTTIVYGEGGAFGDAEALECAHELAAILGDYRNLLSVSPPKRLMAPLPDDGGLEDWKEAPAAEQAVFDKINGPDALFAILRTTLGFNSPDAKQAGDEGYWLWEQIDYVDDYGGLWLRYLRLCDRINGTHDADDWGDGGGHEPAEVE